MKLLLSLGFTVREIPRDGLWEVPPSQCITQLHGKKSKDKYYE